MEDKQNKQNSRRLKVYGRAIVNGNKFKTVPEIRLKGQWLKEIGFIPGQNVNVSQNGNCLTITVIPHV